MAQRCILIFLGLVLVLTTVPTAAFFPVPPPSSSRSLRRELLAHLEWPFFSCHGSGSPVEMVQEGETVVEEIAYDEAQTSTASSPN